MKRFYIRGVIYLLPLLIVLLAIYIVDPYYLFTDSKKYDEDKFKIGYSYDQGRRYKINTYLNNPKDKIILGASEINVISERNIPEEGWHSLSYGGAPLQESLRMYWVIDSIHNLKEIIIAPEFIKYFLSISSNNGDPYYANFDWNTSQSVKAFEIYNNKLDYFIDKYTLKSTWSYLLNKLRKENLSSVPNSTKETFWDSQLDYAKETYNNVIIENKIPEINKKFSEIKDNAINKSQNIKIVIPIQHVDLLKYEFQDGVFEYYKDYLKMLVDTFGKVYYFAYTENISDKNNLFSDPFHYQNGDLYIDGLFRWKNVTLLNKDNIDVKLDSIKETLFKHG